MEFPEFFVDRLTAERKGTAIVCGRHYAREIGAIANCIRLLPFHISRLLHGKSLNFISNEDVSINDLTRAAKLSFFLKKHLFDLRPHC